MTTHCPVPLVTPSGPVVPSRTTARRSAPPWPVAPPGSWRYVGLPRWRWPLPLAACLTATFLALVFFGIGRHRPAARSYAEDDLPLLRIAIPPVVKELENPDPTPNDQDETHPIPAEYAPSLIDSPRLALPTDFVQVIDYSTLLPRPDLSAAKVFVIPPNIRHGGKAGNGIGEILNLKDLDRVPQPLVQPSPIFPIGLRREVETATVHVEFVVDTAGYVINPVIVDTTHVGFNEAALTGVGKWKFRPGMKGGRKVNTRMLVPIVFRIVEDGT